jgi:transcriptional regulator GlxA family with amidase domain
LSELRRRSAQGVFLGAVCAGVFPLAEAGLLTGRQATTHWTLADQFRRQFPRVILDEDALLIEHEGFLLGGGMTAYFDVGLRLIQRMAGAEVARDCAAIFLLDPHRRFQSPFVPAGLGLSERDPILAKALDWVLAQQSLDFGVEQWASAVAIEKRTLERRAKAAWGFGPAERLRRLRLDRARILLSGAALSWDEVAERCGYRDPAAFRRLFLKRFGQAPGEYRRRFG